MTIPTAPPSVDGTPPSAPRRSDRFFSWIAGLGIARSEGWIGGVAAGIAARLRIDPLIVRGILVVATLCGLPLILIYAIAWALLPDAEGRIHVRALLQGRFEAAQLGILAGIVVGLMALSPLSILGLMLRIATGPYGGYDYVFGGPSSLSGFGFILGLALVIVLLVFIVRAARRTPGGTPADPRMASAASAPPASPVSVGESGIAAETDGRGADAVEVADAAIPASVPALEPPAAPAPADADDLEAWRAQHAAWQQQDRAWREQQQDAERAAREQARREREEAAAAFSAEAAERRRISRASKPRASFAYVATALGFALVTGAVVWLWSQTPDAVTAALAMFSATLVLAFAMIIAGIARRRSGFLAFVATATLVVSMIFGAGATVGDVRFGYVELSNAAASDVRQPFGSTRIQLLAFEGGDSQPITVQKGEGFTEISVNPGVELDLTATLGDAAVSVMQNVMTDDGGWETSGPTENLTGRTLSDGSRVIRATVTSDADPNADTTAITRVPVTLDQRSGTIFITYYVLADEETSE